ncbi:hypothetical protein JOD20_000569 [Herpetosiphon giganteus]|nr:hypothetical protein [Herpetosiphon giganteus]
MRAMAMQEPNHNNLWESVAKNLTSCPSCPSWIKKLNLRALRALRGFKLTLNPDPSLNRSTD